LSVFGPPSCNTSLSKLIESRSVFCRLAGAFGLPSVAIKLPYAKDWRLKASRARFLARPLSVDMTSDMLSLRLTLNFFSTTFANKPSGTRATQHEPRRGGCVTLLSQLSTKVCHSVRPAPTKRRRTRSPRRDEAPAQALVGAAVAPGLCGGLTACAPVVDLVLRHSHLARSQLRGERHGLIGKPPVPERGVAPRTVPQGDSICVVGIATTRLTLRQGRHPDQRHKVHGGHGSSDW